MAPTRTKDLVMIFSGGFPFSKVFRVDSDFDLLPYHASCKALNYQREVRAGSRGVDADISANLNTLMSHITNYTDDRLETLGQVCLLGRSEGCALALALAAELNDQGVTDLPLSESRTCPFGTTGET